MQATFSVLMRLRAMMLFACLGAAVPAYAAGPSGGVVSAGSATITQSAAQTTIKQSSDKAVINWGNFSIGSGSAVRFVQPSASSIALNRVTGTQASIIQGALQANGQVWVLNPNGVLIAPGGQVAAGSFLATTRSLTDQQFMAGNYAFTDGGVPGASVINQGSIIVAEGGYAVLAGEAVRNEGYIEANLGQVVLGGAKAFTLDITGDNTLTFVVTAPVEVSPTDGKAIIDNTGSIQAAGGRVLMTARAASQVVGQVINTDGVVAATSAQMVNGKIVLDGGPGSVSVAGDLNASGKGVGQTGGAIDVNAQKIQVKATAKLDVSGDAGGGKIAIGGGGPNTRTQSFTPAVSTTIASGARFDASALTRGDGGEIVVFTSLTNPVAFTQVAGSLTARGGMQGGAGGFVETSGYRLDVNGIVVDASAPKGRRGLWLLDPADIEIGTGASGAGFPCTIISSDCTYMNNSTVGFTLGLPVPMGTDMLISATNSIVVNGAISWSSQATLTLAASTIRLNSPITALDAKGGLKLNGSTIEITAGAFIGGALEVNATGGIPAGSSFTIPRSGAAVNAGSVTIRAINVTINNALNSTAGNLTIGGVGSTGDVTINSALSSSSNMSITATTVNINSSLSVAAAGSTISVEAPGGSINVASDFIRGSTTLSAANVTFSSTGTAGPLNVTATSTINLDANYAPGASVLAAPLVNWNASWSSSNTELQTNRVDWGAAGAYTLGAGTVLTVGVPTSLGTTTFNLGRDLTLQATRININNPLAWSTYQLKLKADQSVSEAVPSGGVALSAALTGTNGAKLVVADSFAATGLAQTISLTGTPTKQSTFTLVGIGGLPQTEGTEEYSAGITIKNKVIIDNSGGSSGSSGSSEAAVVVTPVITTTSTTTAAAEAAAKAAADAAAAKAAADAATAKASALDTATKVVVEQAITQAVATVVASTSAAVFVAPVPAPPVTTATSSASTTTSSAASTTSTDTTTSSSSASTTSTATTASTTTATTTTAATTTATTATAGTSSSAQSTTVTQEFVEPLSVTTLSSTTSTVSDPGDKSVATTSTTSGPTSQTATPASTTATAPSAPSLTPVAVSRDGADAGDFTLQTVKPPAPVTAPKQQARTTERVSTTAVSPGISLQSTQKTPPPSGSVLGREISGVGNSSAW